MNLTARLSNTKRVRRVLTRAIVCGMLLILPSCNIIPKLREPEPAPNVPKDFNGTASAENSSQLGIEEFFNNVTLTTFIGQGMAGNRELMVLNEEVRVARNEVLARSGAYLPFVTAGLDAGLDRPSAWTPLGAAERQLLTPTGGHFPDPLGNFQLGFNLFWQLDIWRELRNARDAAGQRYIAAMERRNYFVTKLVAEIAENYYGLMALDKRIDNLDVTIGLQDQSYKVAKARMENGRGNELPVQRFLSEVRKNQSEKLIIRQEIVQVENRINFLINRFPQPVERDSSVFLNLNFEPLKVGVPPQLLQNRPDIRQAERDLRAAGLDILVARAHFFPRVAITADVGYQAFNPAFLFSPESLIYGVAGNLIQPVVNMRAIKAEYMTANAKQLQALYNYQRVILNAFTEVINRMSKVDNYARSLEIKRQQLASLEAAVSAAMNLFQSARTEYVDVLFSQRDLMDARMVYIDTKREQLAAVINTYQALGGGDPSAAERAGLGPNGGDHSAPLLPPPQLLPPVPPE